jgi:hypothetical protein
MPIGMKKELHRREHKQILGISLVVKNTQSAPSLQIGKGNVATSLLISAREHEYFKIEQAFNSILSERR